MSWLLVPYRGLVSSADGGRNRKAKVGMALHVAGGREWAYPWWCMYVYIVGDEQWLASLSRSEVLLADRFVLIGGPCQSAVGGYNDSSAL